MDSNQAPDQGLDQALAEAGLDALLVTRDANQRFLEGYTGSECYLLASPKGRWLIADPRYSEQAAQECRTATAVSHRDPFPPYAEVIATLAKEHGLRRIGFEKATLTYGQYEAIALELGRLEGVQFLPTDGLVERLRMVKTPAEITDLRGACAIADRALEVTLGMIHEGMSELELARTLDNQMVLAGAEGVSFQTIVAFGAHASMPHAVPSAQTRLKPGDLILIDYGALYRGYHSDTTRTFVFGQATPRQQEAYAAVLGSQLKGIQAIRPGIEGREVDAASRAHVVAAGLPEFNHGIGHGVGLEIHELPFMNKKCQERLLPGMVVTVEPGAYLPGWGGIRIEDTVLVGVSGPECLTRFPKDTLRAV
jgi:Xaa-Pro aminopeptidase